MSDHTFNFEVNGEALVYLCRAMDQYVEKWPGGHPVEQEIIKNIQFNLHKASLEYRILKDN